VERLISDVAVSGGERADDGGVGSERQTIDDARRHGLVPQLLLLVDRLTMHFAELA
jgi:hypothetical protein